MERSLISELMQTHEKIYKCLMPGIVRYKVRNINYSFDAARITLHLPFSQEELVELGVSCRSDYIKLLYRAVNTVSTREAVSAERIADIV